MTAALSQIFDRSAIYENLGVEDVQFVKELYEEFLVQLNDLERFMAKFGFASANSPEMAFFSHRLKSSSSVVGALQLEKSLKIIELAAKNNTSELPVIFSTLNLLIEPTRSAIEAEINLINGGLGYNHGFHQTFAGH